MPSADVSEAVRVLRRGGLVALPTETVYGLGADASNELAVRRIFAAKGRPSTHPLIVHVASADAARAWVAEFPPLAQTLAEHFWPGPLTLILKRSPRASDAVTGGQDTVAVRVPNHPLALELLGEFGGGIAAPSANTFGHVSPTTAAHVRSELGDAVDLVLDGGPCAVGVESTIVDLTSGAPRLLRPGGISKEQLESALRLAVLPPAAEVRAPGMLASHYAPRAGLVLVATEAELFKAAEERVKAGAKVAVLSTVPVPLPNGAVGYAVPADAAEYARQLYAQLRQLDEKGYDVIVAALPPEAGLGLAVRDRLTRAGGPRES
jgi:L-threonylcarbamoyladenylate synthase